MPNSLPRCGNGASGSQCQSPTTYPRKPHQIGHVAISLGNAYLLEARGSRYGVTIGPVRPSLDLACKVRELYAPALLR